MLTAWTEPDRAVVIVVGPHDRSAVDVYDQLLAALNLPVPADERENPRVAMMRDFHLPMSLRRIPSLMRWSGLPVNVVKGRKDRQRHPGAMPLLDGDGDGSGGGG